MRSSSRSPVRRPLPLQETESWSSNPVQMLLLQLPRTNRPSRLSIEMFRISLTFIEIQLTVTRRSIVSQVGERHQAKRSYRNIGSCRERSLVATSVAEILQTSDRWSADLYEEDNVSDERHQVVFIEPDVSVGIVRITTRACRWPAFDPRWRSDLVIQSMIHDAIKQLISGSNMCHRTFGDVIQLLPERFRRRSSVYPDETGLFEYKQLCAAGVMRVERKICGEHLSNCKDRLEKLATYWRLYQKDFSQLHPKWPF